ncbi:MAG: hypothetical protein EOP86_16305 [Verrucomicrobiaceae bacterium]|nr:MAG: hypothetical protein EOP86_16305 [Verrucomicrobiaceae bacterium]
MKTYTLHYAHGETVSGLTFTAALTAVAAKHGVTVQSLGILEDHIKQSSRILIWLPGDQEKNNINRAVAELLTVECEVPTGLEAGDGKGGGQAGTAQT